jgi:hypothetical protein
VFEVVIRPIANNLAMRTASRADLAPGRLPPMRLIYAMKSAQPGINRRFRSFHGDNCPFQTSEHNMRISRKIPVVLAAAATLAAPVAASAAPGVSAARAGSAIQGENGLEGNSSWIIGLVGLLAGITAIILISDNDEDSPVSP